jgi:D-glycero-D-manno-heptose 1,7-bisphosphate phosphatase
MGIGQMTLSAVFLDRDGVINEAILRKGKPYPPASLDQLVILPGVLDALSSLRAAGFLLIVVTNQPDVARGSTSKESVDLLNAALKERLPLDAIFTCYHDNADNCDCRKPKPGLLLTAARDFGIDLTCSYMVGDRRCDVEAGQRAGCKTFYIDYGYAEKQPEFFNFRVSSLQEAALMILKECIL